MNWMNLCWILDEKWRERLPHSPLSSPTPTPAVSRLSSRSSSAPLYSRSSSSFSSTSSPRVSLFAILPCRSLSTYSPRSYHVRVLFFRLSSSCVALSGAALQKTNQRPTDRFHRAVENISSTGPIFNYYPPRRRTPASEQEAEVTSAEY